jgi:hypothetical protein
MRQVAGRNATGFYVQMYAYSHSPSTQPNAPPRQSEHSKQWSQFTVQVRWESGFAFRRFIVHFQLDYPSESLPFAAQ